MTASENNEVAKHRRSQTKVCVTGAWLEGDDPGDRKFIKIGDLTLESGEVLPDITIAYQTWGEINEARDNVILVSYVGLAGETNVDDYAIIGGHSAAHQF